MARGVPQHVWLVGRSDLAGPVAARQLPGRATVSRLQRGPLPPPRTGDYTLDLTGFGDATLTFDGQQIITMTGADATLSNAASPVLHLIAGQSHTLNITYQADHPFDSLEPGTLLLQWKTPPYA